MSIDVYDLMAGDQPPSEIRAYLDGAGYDMLAEVDMAGDVLHVLHRTEGKFMIPVHESRYSEQRIFFGSLYEFTDYLALQDRLRLISHIHEEAVVFLAPRDQGWSYDPAVYSLEGLLGLSRDGFREALERGSLPERVKRSRRKAFAAMLAAAPDAPETLRLDFRTDDGQTRALDLRLWDLREQGSGLPYALVFTPVKQETGPKK